MSVFKKSSLALSTPAPAPLPAANPQALVSLGGRKLHPDLKLFLDQKLFSLAAFHEALDQKDPNKIAILAGEAMIGFSEATGANDGSRINQIQYTTGGHSGDSWCMDYQQTRIGYAELALGVRSLLFLSGLCTAVWAKTPERCRISVGSQQPGDLLVYEHGTLITGHVATFVSPAPQPGSVLTTEGNCANAVRRNARPLLASGDLHLLGILRSF